MFVLVAVLLGCAPEEGDQGPRADEADVPGWTIAAAPDLVLSGGVLNGDSVHVHGIAGAVFGGHGDIVVAVGGGDNRVVVFTDSGRVIRVTGRRGKGPGEFGAMSGLFTVGDRIAVWDWRNGRFSFLSGRGDPERDFRFQAPRGRKVVGLLDDGSFLTTTVEVSVRKGEPRIYELWTSEGAAADRLIGPIEPADGTIRLTYEHSRGRATIMTELPMGCSPRTVEGVLGNRLFVAEPGTGTVTAMSRSGDAEVIYRAGGRDTVTTAMVEKARTLIEAIMSSVGRPKRGPDGIYQLANVQFPAGTADSVVGMLGDVGDQLQTVWSDMVTDRSGRLWLRRSNCGSTRAHEMWDVLDTVGNRIATAVSPADFRIWSVDGDRVLASTTDSLGVQQIAVLRVAR
jgi:hypothetical protein